MSQSSFQINIPDHQSSSLTRSDTRQFAWSATPRPPPPSRPLTSSKISINPALLSYQSIPLPSTESSTPAAFVTPNTRTKLNSKGVRGVRLTQDEDTFLVQLCLKNELAYGLHKGSTTFWAEIRRQFAKDRQRDYTSPKRRVDNLIEGRLVHLAMLGTGDKDQESTFTKAIDDWITVVNGHNHDSEKKKEAAKQQARNIRTEERVRDNLTQRVGHKRSYSSSSSSSSIPSSEDLEETQTNIPPSIPSRSTSITPAVSTTFDSRQQRSNYSRKKTRTSTEESPSVVALTNAVELLVRSQCERGRAGTEASNVEVRATEAIKAVEARVTESIRVAEEARATEATRVAEEARVVRLDMAMRMERLERMLSLLVNRAERDKPR